MAVGFVRKSGLDYIIKRVNDNNSTKKINLIIGALQNYNKQIVSNKMDKGTAKYLNEMINKNVMDIFTYMPSFYHGKYYCFTDDKMVYIILGSSNISHSAFFNNYELDIFFKYKKGSIESKEFIDWFDELKSNCVKISELNEELYLDTNSFNQEEFNEPKSTSAYDKVSIQDFADKIDKLDDDEIKYRQALWMSKKPSDIYENIQIEALQEYVLYIYKNYKLAVFESFKPNNAYFVMDSDNLDVITEELCGRKKRDLLECKLYVAKGYHIKSKKRMEERINKFFDR